MVNGSAYLSPSLFLSSDTLNEHQTSPFYLYLLISFISFVNVYFKHAVAVLWPI